MGEREGESVPGFEVLGDGREQQLGGYDTARREVSRQGRGAKREALDREQQLMGQASQGLAQSGLGSTTIGANLQRGIASDTNRSMAGVDENLAGLYGNLALGRGGVEAQGSERLGQLAGARGDIMSQLAQMRSLQDLYSSSPWGGNNPLPTREPGLGQSLLGGFQTGLGTYMGMGGGGGGGMGGGMPQGGGDPMAHFGTGQGMNPGMTSYLYDLQNNPGMSWQNIGAPFQSYGGGYG